MVLVLGQMEIDGSSNRGRLCLQIWHDVIQHFVLAKKEQSSVRVCVQQQDADEG